ncbi:MAG: amine oxidase [Gemmatimonadetes bacterium]|jgi:protoporphyrinogen oxidase|nr:amine oxidase [Gemmatimonadota bacterium]
MSHRPIAVIAGAGPAGLTAAYELLTRTDVQPLIFERTHAIGGIAQTFNYKGNRIDIGGHRFFSKSERVMSWWFSFLPRQGAPASDTAESDHAIDYVAESIVRRILPDVPGDVPGMDGGEGGTATLVGARTREETRVAPDPEREDEVMLHRPRLSRIYYKRHFFPYPIGITFTVARRLGLINTALIGVSYCKAQLMPLKDETFLDAFFVNRFGRRLYETFFRDYTEKVWGVKCSEIRADWGAQRVKGLSLKRAVVHAVKDLLSTDFQKAQEERETSLITRFFYPKYGPGQMWETVADQVTKAGGEIRFGHRVVGVFTENDAVTHVEVEDEAGRRSRVACDYFFSTMPVKELVKQTSPTPPAEVREVADGLQYRDFLTVGLLMRKLHVEVKGHAPAPMVQDNWIYVQDGGVQVGRIQVFNNWSPYMVADRANTVWIGLEYFVNQDDVLWKMPDENLVKLGTLELERIGFIKGEDVLDGCVLRMPKAYPAYFGTYDRLGVVQDWAARFTNLFLVGRNGMHRYNNQDHSMLTAMMAVDNIIEGRTDQRNLWDVNLEEVYHEEKSA